MVYPSLSGEKTRMTSSLHKAFHVLLLAISLCTSSARATQVPVIPHIIESLEAQRDSVPPSKPVFHLKNVHRGLIRERGTSSDDLGWAQFAVESEDDRSKSFEIGYRLTFVRGTLPVGLVLPSEATRPLGCGGAGNFDECLLDLVWLDGLSNDQEAFDFSFVAVAVDKGGNESELSDTITVRDPGSTASMRSGFPADKAFWLWIFAGVLVVTGFVGVIAPVLPGAPLVLAGLIVAAWAEDFQHVGVWTLVFLGLLTALTYVVDAIAAALGVKRVGASKHAVWGAVIGTMVGVFFGIPGILLGPFLGAVAGELFVSRDVKHVGRAGVAAWIGFIIGTLGKLALMFTMVGVFIVARLI